MTTLDAAFASRNWSIIGRVVLFWAGYLAILLLAAKVKALAPPPWHQLVWGLVSIAALFPLTLVFLRWDGRSRRDVGLNFEAKSVARLGLGAILGLAVYGLNVLIVSAVAGPIRFSWGVGIDPAGVVLVVATTVARSGMEELGFRGYPLRTLVPSLGFWKAQGIVAVAFGLCHFAFGWSWTSILLGVIPSAFLFGMAASASGGLALPIGLHAGLNLARWSVGENGAAGIWTMVVDETAQAGIAKVAPTIGVIVGVLGTLALWWWHQTRTQVTDNRDASS